MEHYSLICRDSKLIELVDKCKKNKITITFEDTEAEPRDITKGSALNPLNAVLTHWQIGIIFEGKSIPEYYVIHIKKLASLKYVKILWDILNKARERLYCNCFYDLTVVLSNFGLTMENCSWNWNFNDSSFYSRLSLPVECQNTGLAYVIKYINKVVPALNIDMRGAELKKVFRTNSLKKNNKFLGSGNDKDAYDYCYYDIYYLYLIWKVCDNSLSEYERKLLKIEQNLIPMWLEMSLLKWNYDTDLVKEYSKQVENRLILLEEELKNLIKEDIKPSQRTKLIPILEKKYNISLKSETNKTGKSLDRAQCNKFKEYREFAIIIEHGALVKIKSTYLDNFNNDNFVPHKIKPAGTLTGRISADFQQLSKEESYGINIRSCIKPYEGYEFVFIDIDSQELRFLNELTYITLNKDDKNFSRAFINLDPSNKDWKPISLHDESAKSAFHIDENHPKFKIYRKVAKMFNFAILYGAGLKKLTISGEELGADSSEIKTLYDSYRKVYKEVNEFMDKQRNPKLIKGFYSVYNLYGKRYRTTNKKITYKFVNYVIQGSCAYWLKMKLIKIYSYCKKHNITIFAQVHDEIVFMIKKNQSKAPLLRIKEYLEDNKSFHTPIIATIESSDKSWGDKKSLKIK